MNSQTKEIIRVKTIQAKLLYADMNKEYFEWCGYVWIRGELVATYEGVIQ